jgi:hypothetical protein
MPKLYDDLGPSGRPRAVEVALQTPASLWALRAELEDTIGRALTGPLPRPRAGETREDARDLVVGFRKIREHAQGIVDFVDEHEIHAIDLFDNIDLQKELREDHAAGKH